MWLDTLLNRAFTQRQLNQLLQSGYMEYVVKAAERYDLMCDDFLTMLQRVYKYLAHHHRNEYFYKNEMLNKIVIGKHSLNTTSALRELPVGKSIADFVIINGKAQVYEIKTELDNLDRLDSQLNDYFKAFGYVNVITDPKNIDLISTKINENVGIYCLTNRNQIHCVRKAKKNISKIDSYTMFKVLRKPEFEAINSEEFGYLPEVGASKYYIYNYHLFKKISREKQQDYLVHYLKERYFQRYKGKGDLLKEIPSELRELVYFSSYNDKQIMGILNTLKKGGQ